jgi:uncharacterized alkaline shock family protein YloU
VADAVVEKIAAQAASEVDDVEGVAPRLLGLTRPGARHAPRPQVAARIDGRLARLTVSVGVRYPAPLRHVSDAVRRHVTETVGHLASLDVREVDVEVVALVREPLTSARVR